MPCYYPITAWRARNGDTRLVFTEKAGLKSTRMEIPCGQCLGCRLEKSRQWAIRAMHEASQYENNSFLTLTYSDDKLPLGNSLYKPHIVAFLKALRRHVEPIKIRFFQCGEYGEAFSRPHHHMVLFNYAFPDVTLWSIRHDTKLYRSPSLEKLWPHGFSSIGEVNFESVAYAARYVLKKVTGNRKDEHYGSRQPEYITMSRRPGIGRPFYDKFKTDLYNHDQCVIRDNFVVKPPKYYDAIYDTEDPVKMKIYKGLRMKHALENKLSQKAIDTKEELALLHQKRLASRSFENPTAKPLNPRK